MKKLFKWILILSGISLGASMFLYYTHRQAKQHRVQRATDKNGDFYRGLDNFDDFMKLQGAPLSGKFADVNSIKLVYQVSSGKLYFINSAKYRFHYEFCRTVLGDDNSLEAFNVYNYGNLGRRAYYLANLNYYRRSHIYALEFVSDDEIDGKQIATLYQAVRDNSYLQDSLHVLVSSDYLTKLDEAGKLDLKKIYPSDIYKGQQYQVLNAGNTYGTLRKVNDLQKEYASIRPQDIIIIHGTPVTVPVCAGIITDAYQTPLSHVNILCHNRAIPAAVDTRIWKKASVDYFVGKPTTLLVSNDTLKLDSGDEKGMAAFWKKKSPAKRRVLQSDLSYTAIYPIRNIDHRDGKVVGNKAAGMGELSKIMRKNKGKFEIPEGAFAIPFYYYKQHISNPVIKQQIDHLLQTPVYANNNDSLHAQLKAIRKAIKQQPVDPKLIAAVRQMIISNNAGDAYRFRSSSNAEDMDGFSGAGLYESKTGKLNDTAKSIDKAIRDVWASAWNDEAYSERALYNIDHSSMMMGILAHRSFPDEKANGVAITKNLYRPGFPGFTINVQAGETSVVSPPPGVTCEQFVCMQASDINLMNTDIVTDYITASNISNNKRVLSSKQVAQLYEALERIKVHYYYNLRPEDQPELTDYGLDVEFKFDRNDKLYIKQVRPYR